MSFLDEVKKVQAENYVAPIDMDAIVESAYQQLLEEQLEQIKKTILEKVKMDAAEGVQSDEIKCSYELINSFEVIISGEYETGTFKYDANIQENEKGVYLQFPEIYSFNDGEELATIMSGTLGASSDWLISKTAHFKLTSFGHQFVWDLKEKCGLEEIRLNGPYCDLLIDVTDQIFRKPKIRLYDDIEKTRK